MQGKKILESLASVPRPQDYPTADYIILKDVTTIILHDDGRITTRYYQFRRIATDYGRDKFSDIPVLFNERYQKINVISVQALMLDGSVVATPEYGINQITPHALEKAPSLSDFQQKIISLVGLELGGFAEFEYEIEDLTAWQASFYGLLPIRLGAPALHREFVFEVPATKHILFHIEGIEANDARQEQTLGSVKRFTFTFRDQSLWDKEDDHALTQIDCPKLVYSENKTWHDWAATLATIVDDSVVPNELLEKRVAEVTKDLECPTMKAYALHKHVLEAIATVSFDAYRYHFQSRPTAEILRSGYGTPFDKALLLCSLLQTAGLKAQVALVAPAKSLPNHVINPMVFESIWVIIQELSLYLRADKPVPEARREHLEGSILLVAAKNGDTRLALTDVGSLLGNRFSAKVTITVKKDASGEGAVDATLAGIYNPYFSLMTADADQLTSWVKSFIGKFPSDPELDKHWFKLFSPSHSVVSASFKLKTLTADPEHRILMEMPAALTGIGGFTFAPEVISRNSTLALPGSLKQELTLEVNLPKDWTLQIVPAAITAHNEVFDFEQRFTVSEEADKPVQVTFNQQLQFKNKYLEPQYYQQFRVLVVENARVQKRLIFVVKKTEP